MSIFNQIKQEKQIHIEDTIVSESWTASLLAAAVTYGIIQVGIKVVSAQTIRKLIKNPKLQKYITLECDKIYKVQKKKDKSLITKLPDSKIEKIRQELASDTQNSFYNKTFHNHFNSKDLEDTGAKFGNYTVIFLSDTDHIQSVCLVLYSKDKTKYQAHKIPAPTKKDLGFYES